MQIGHRTYIIHPLAPPPLLYDSKQNAIEAIFKAVDGIVPGWWITYISLILFVIYRYKKKTTYLHRLVALRLSYDYFSYI